MEQRRLKCSGGVVKGADDRGGASKEVWDSVGSWGHDNILPLGPESLRAIVHVDPVWTWCGTMCFYCLPDSVSAFQSEFRLLQDVFKFCDLCMSLSFNILLIFHHVMSPYQLDQGTPH